MAQTSKSIPPSARIPATGVGVDPVAAAPAVAARRARSGRRRWTWAAVAAVVVIVGIAAVRWGPGLYNQFGYLGVQRTATDFGLSSDTVVFETDATRSAELVSQHGADYVRAMPARIPVADLPDPVGRRMPAAVAPFRPTTAAAATYITSHTLKTPGGRDVFIVVHALCDVDEEGNLSLTVVAKTWVPADWTLGSRARGAGSAAMRMSVSHDVIFRMYAGAPDPSDTNAFRIPYDLGAEKGVMIARIVDEGSPPKVTVKLQLGESR